MVEALGVLTLSEDRMPRIGFLGRRRGVTNLLEGHPSRIDLDIVLGRPGLHDLLESKELVRPGVYHWPHFVVLLRRIQVLIDLLAAHFVHLVALLQEG